MAVTQYIGPRIAPVFADPVEWSSTKQYEPLTVVTYQGNSFTSRQAVPVGIDINNTNFWVETGNYNAQVEAYRQETLGFVNSIQHKAFAFENVSEMQNSTQLYVGAICHTNGFHESGDGGAAWYVVSASGEANGMDVFLCGNYFAHLIVTSDSVVPETYGAYGDMTHDDTTVLEYVLNLGKTIRLVKSYLFSRTLFVKSSLYCEDGWLVANANLNAHVVFGVESHAFTYQKAIINIDGNQKNGYLVALDYAHNSYITINAKNVKTCPYVDFYDPTGNMDYNAQSHNYECNININATAIPEGGDYFMYIGGGDNVYGDLQGVDFVTGLMMQSSGTQTLHNLHLWLLNGSLWENSTLIKDGITGWGSNIKINADIIYQDTYRYGIWGRTFNVNCNTWLQHVNRTIVPQSTIDAYPPITAKATQGNVASAAIGFTYTNLLDNAPTIEGQVAFAFNTINLQKSNFYFYDADEVPIGSCVTVTLPIGETDPTVAHLPEPNEMLVYSPFSTRRILQFATSTHNNLFFRTRAFWAGAPWSAWTKLN